MERRIDEVLIDGYSKKGHGSGFLTRADGTPAPIEVLFSLPGERVLAESFARKRKCYQAKIKELIIPSEKRIQARCKHFGSCGGCRWQHLAYESQLENKQRLIDDCFKDLISSKELILPIIAAKNPWNYRNKMEFSFSVDKEGKHYLGLILDSSRGKVFDLSECHLCSPWVVTGLDAIRQWWKEENLLPYRMYSNEGALETVTFREGKRTGDRMVNLTVSGNPDFALKKRQLESFVALLRAAIEPLNSSKLSIFLTIKQRIKKQPTRLFEMHLHGSDHIRETLFITMPSQKEPVPLTFKISSSAFFQPNTEQAEILYSSMLKLAKIPEGSIVYDLYCGTGTLGICAAKQAKQVVSIELSREAVLDARENAVINGIDHITILAGKVEEKLQEIEEQKLFPAPDVVVVDPPRMGLDPKAIQHLIKLSPKTLVYISCNPVTQAENVKELMKSGYSLKILQPVDQFPHTLHVENIAILEHVRT